MASITFSVLMAVLVCVCHGGPISWSGDDVSWSDEFNGAAGVGPSTDKWSFDLGDGSSKGIQGWGNSELQYYTNRVENSATDGDGHLVITALKPKETYDCYYGDCGFTSARLVSKFSQMYGRFEARIKTPSGKGIWPAFWMLGQNIDEVGWPKCGEIDILELRGSQPSKVSGALHGPGYSGGESISAAFTTKGKSFDEEFHVFAVDWKPKSIQWSVDDEVYFTMTPEDIPPGTKWAFDLPQKMLLNLAIGGNFDGYPVKNETFPKRLFVDYVRVYSHEKEHVPVPEMSESVETSDGSRNTYYLFNLIVMLITRLLQ